MVSVTPRWLGCSVGQNPEALSLIAGTGTRQLTLN
jgi:hypothetical protein